MARLTVWPVAGLPEIREGDDLAGLIVHAVEKDPLRDRDVVVVAQKIVSKAEGRVVALSSVTPSERAVAMAAEASKDPRAIEVVLRESRAIVRWERGVIISETHHGFVCANAGVDRSNAGAPDSVVLLPVDPDASAARLREALNRRAGVDVAVVITDTFGRAWREGHVNVAIGVAGMPALRRYAGQYDPDGYELRVTEIALADEIAAAAELVMGKLDRVPVAVARGIELPGEAETAQA
ncbi:MAG: coenzyme F420-0:L-glutamate ligase, partial [Chloroflexi bacterium]|nr:coenzyme F420-0:L-glutamate ligase [Chloroflexota bacterium]